MYEPAHRRESVLRDRLRDFVRDVFDGQAGSVVLSLVEDAALSKAELEAIEQRIADAEAGRSERAGARRRRPSKDAPVIALAAKHLRSRRSR